MRVLFMGTPEFAVASLRRLGEDGHTVCGVFTQPDKPKNRGHKLAFSPVKEYAITENIPVYQPVSMRDEGALDLVRELAPELTVVAAYGKLLPEDILNVPPYGSVNVHSSLLPKYRGSAPINWAILNGDRETGVTIQKMVRDLDAGDIILQRATPIGADENAAALYDRLALMGGELLTQAVAQIEAGIAACTPQDHAQATQAPMLSKALSPVDWTRSAQAIHNQIRGLYPWPAAATDILTGEPVKLWAARTAEMPAAARPGTILSAGKEGIDVACGDGRALRILELQAPGGKRMSAADYLRGHPIQI